MLKQTIFVLGFIWFITGAGSLLLDPFVGFNRVTALRELNEFYRNGSNALSVRSAFRFIVYWTAYLGFFFPASCPLIGIGDGFLSLVMLATIGVRVI